MATNRNNIGTHSARLGTSDFPNAPACTEANSTGRSSAQTPAGIIADIEGGLDAKSKANAEFIVRACNNHEELLTACKMSLQDAKDALSGDWEPARHGWESIVEHLTRVIRKAEEKTVHC